MARLRFAALVVTHSIARADDPWAAVHALFDHYTNLTDCDGCNCQGCHGFAFTAGNASGRQFSYEKETRLDQILPLASASKFPAALVVAGAIADGHLKFETLAHEVFPWWTSSAADPRSRVTVRHLLSFRSGFYWIDASSGNASCMDFATSILFTPEACARQIYQNAPFRFTPGVTWAYNSFHLQVAAAMAAKAAGLTNVQLLLKKYLIDKLQLKHTGWLVGPNPLLAAGMYSTANDYDVILRSYLACGTSVEARLALGALGGCRRPWAAAESRSRLPAAVGRG